MTSARRVVFFAATMFEALLATSGLGAQGHMNPRTRGKCNIPGDGELPRYEIRQLSRQEVVSLRQHLQDRCWEEAIQTYFRKYRSDLGDWIVYIDRLGRVYQGFTSDGDTSSTFKEQRYVWAVVFMDLRPEPITKPSSTPQATPVDAGIHFTSPQSALDVRIPQSSSGGGDKSGGGGDTTDFFFHRRVVTYHRSPIINTVIGLLGKTVGLGVTQEDDLKDSTRSMRLSLVYKDSVDEFWVAYGRFGLVDNSQIDLDVVPVYGKVLAPGLVDRGNKDATKPLQSVYAAMANARRHTFEVGALAAMSYGARTATYNQNQQITSESSRWTTTGVVTINVNFPGAWFTLPPYKPELIGGRIYGERLRPNWQEVSFGIFGGTNILRGSIGDELAAGFQLGHLVGDAGLAAGWNWVLAQHLQDGKVVNGRQAHLLLGIDFRL